MLQNRNFNFRTFFLKILVLCCILVVGCEPTRSRNANSTVEAVGSISASDFGSELSNEELRIGVFKLCSVHDFVSCETAFSIDDEGRLIGTAHGQASELNERDKFDDSVRMQSGLYFVSAFDYHPDTREYYEAPIFSVGVERRIDTTYSSLDCLSEKYLDAILLKAMPVDEFTKWSFPFRINRGELSSDIHSEVDEQRVFIPGFPFRSSLYTDKQLATLQAGVSNKSEGRRRVIWNKNTRFGVLTGFNPSFRHSNIESNCLQFRENAPNELSDKGLSTVPDTALGYSGSPVIDSNGIVIAVHSSAKAHNSIDPETGLFRKNTRRTDSDLGSVTYVIKGNSAFFVNKKLRLNEIESINQVSRSKSLNADRARKLSAIKDYIRKDFESYRKRTAATAMRIRSKKKSYRDSVFNNIKSEVVKCKTHADSEAFYINEYKIDIREDGDVEVSFKPQNNKLNGILAKWSEVKVIPMDHFFTRRYGYGDEDYPGLSSVLNERDQAWPWKKNYYHVIFELALSSDLNIFDKRYPDCVQHLGKVPFR